MSHVYRNSNLLIEEYDRNLYTYSQYISPYQQSFAVAPSSGTGADCFDCDRMDVPLIKKYENITELEGHFVFSIYYNESNGYCVYQYLLKEGSVFQKAIIKGYYLPKNKKVNYLFRGKFVDDKKYGLQFAAETYEEKIECTEDIISYLSSGAIKGIGVKTATQIYAAYGGKSLQILETDPEQLLKIKGITKGRLEKIKESYSEGRDAQLVARYLINYGLTPNLAAKAYQNGVTSVDMIKKNPYRLCSIRGITFYMADAIARKIGIPDNDPNRLEACARYIIIENEANTGSLAMEKDIFGMRLLQEMNSPFIRKDNVCSYTIKLIEEKKLVYRKVTYYDSSTKCLLYLPEHYHVEKESARLFNNIMQTKISADPADIENYLDEQERVIGFKLDVLQRKAVSTAITNPATIIIGGPGMGKTTIQGLICHYLAQKEQDREVLCIAPTGMAARRLKEATGSSASTIHSLLKLRVSSSEELIDEHAFEQIHNATIIMDEASMADIYVMYTLLRAIGDNCRIIIVGDIGQLPSVGPGSVLRDIVLSHIAPVIQLNNIFRQAKGSSILENTQNIRHGIAKIKTDDDFMMYEMEDLQQIQDQLVSIYRQRVEEYGMDNVMLLCPFKKGLASVTELNRILQGIYNPLSEKKEEVFYRGILYRTGDRVMNLKNDVDVANGDVGYIESIFTNDEERIIRVRFFDSLLVEYEGEDIEHLTHAYAMTVHKVIGSQADCVITCFTSAHKIFLFRNFPLTAISRGKKHVDYVGSYDILKKAIATEMTDNRLSLFWHHLSLCNGHFITI